MKTVMTFGNIVIRIFEYSMVNYFCGHIQKENQKHTMQRPSQFYNAKLCNQVPSLSLSRWRTLRYRTKNLK